jgi:ribonuclease R
MEEMILSLKNYFKSDYKFHDFDEIKKKLKVYGEDNLNLLKNAINNLEEEGFILSKNGKYQQFPINNGLAFGKIKINKSGTGFVHTKEGYVILIENNCLNGALDGDNVVVNEIVKKRKDYFSGSVFKVAKRSSGIVIFQVIGNGKEASLVPYNSKEFINLEINSNQLDNLQDGDLVKVRVSTNNSNGVYYGNIEKIIGNKNELDIDIKSIAAKYDVPYEFSKEIIAEVRDLPREVTSEDIKNRVDLRSENIFTIDCDQTKDRDDAVGVKKLENGNYLLKVNIAHVSHYIRPGTKSFDEAINRCFSHYLLYSVINMLHPIVSNGICSLNPNVDRLTRTVEVEITPSGEIANYQIYDSVIRSKKAMSYSKCNEVFEGKNVSGYEEYRTDLMNMLELYYILETARQRRNFLNFKLLEVKEKSDEYNKIYGFEKNDYGLSGSMIEVFMGIANSIFYSHYAWLTLPFRVHEEPDLLRVQEVLEVLRKSGFKIPKYKQIDCKALNTIINSLGNSEADMIAREYLLRGMKRAKYSSENIGHFATQFDCYGHFTSPIRRVPDLATNALVDDYQTFDYSEENIKKLQDFIEELCTRVNRLEIISEKMENEALEMAMAAYMEDKIGNEVEAYIVEITPNSMFVRTTDCIKGRVYFKDMKDDQYHYDQVKCAVIGRNGNIYHIGDKIDLVVKDASKINRTVDFETVKKKSLKLRRQ